MWIMVEGKEGKGRRGFDLANGVGFGLVIVDFEINLVKLVKSILKYIF